MGIEMDIVSLLTSFEGRINRAKWWLGLLILVIVQWIVWYIIAMTMGVDMMGSSDPAQMEQALTAMGIPLLIISLIFLYPSLALYTKRWHDRGKSGWWTLIILIPIIGGIWALIELGILRGTVGPNQYGPDPLG
jgi:uncharacterized membrane protein YhaH (DUF805 family)